MWPFKKKPEEKTTVVTGTVSPESVKINKKRNFTFDVSVRSLTNHKLNIQFQVSGEYESYEKAVEQLIKNAYYPGQWGTYEYVLPSLKDHKDLYLLIGKEKMKKSRQKKAGFKLCQDHKETGNDYFY
jgi:hypothetical protein